MIAQGLHFEVHKELELRIIKLATILKVLLGVVSWLVTNWQSHAS